MNNLHLTSLINQCVLVSKFSNLIYCLFFNTFKTLFDTNGTVRPNPPPLSVLVRVMVLRITCISCNFEWHEILHIPRHPHHFESLCFISASLLACGRIGLLKSPTCGFGDTCSQGYSPYTLDLYLPCLAIARIPHIFHYHARDWFWPRGYKC